MKTLKTGLENFPIHPFIFALYPVIFLWVDNIDQTPFFAIQSSLIFSLGLALSVYILTGIIYRNMKNAAVIGSIIIILALSYGHIYNFIKEYPVLNNMIGYYRLLAILIGIIAVSMILIWKYKTSLPAVNQTMHTVGFLLIAMAIGQVLWFYSSVFSGAATSSNPQTENNNNPIQNDFQDRDIYYILLDSYGRADLLKSRYDYDNASFIKDLLDLGFVVPECTQSNYNSTVSSLASSLNMEYLTELPIGSLKDDSVQLISYIKHSAVREKFEDMGYTTVTFKSIYPQLDIKDSDIYYDFEESTNQYNKLETENFQYLFFNTTVLRIIIEILEANPEYMFVEDASPIEVYIAQIFQPQMRLFQTRLFKQYEQNLYAFERLEALPDIPGNKFVYAHLYSTHQPFVFTENGQVRWPIEENSAAYKDQITYTNSRMIKIIKTIINESDNPPVIILQGDHNYVNDRERNKILNAYYFPEGGNQQISPDTSPVNTFRLVFNTYFGGNYEILPNIAYTSPVDNLFQFEALPVSCEETTD